MRLLWASFALFSIAIFSLWLLLELIDPAGHSAQASTHQPPPVPADSPFSASHLPRDLSMGRYIGPDGRIDPGMLSDWFLAGEAVHAAMPARAFAGKRIPLQARWFGPGGKRLHRETILVGPRRLRVGFVLPPALTASSGQYRLEIHYGSREIASRDFTVK